MAKKVYISVVDVKNWVKEIAKKAKTDVESAHGIEDGLYENVLRALASGTVPTIQDARELAKEALKALKIDYPRYCA